ncbi:MAG: ABC transporter ATP-binding protein, partial [Lachnospiraceae bacterium]|nr:ABC transporter ATP-binding protein [Lachnospiraceae bacterium]
MKLIFKHMKMHWKLVALAILIKFLGSVSELSLPYILEYIIDEIVPSGNLTRVLLWGSLMFVTAIVFRALNVIANKRAINNAHVISYEIRQKLFEKTMNLSGTQFDALTLPSLISRMTSDSYNVQAAVAQLQSLCVRAPMMLLGGLIMTMLMDFKLSLILLLMMPLLILVIYFISSRGIPMYTKVQKKLDVVVRVMRENITGIRVVKALSKEAYEKRRFAESNQELTKSDVAAATVMAMPGPVIQFLLNIGLSIVVFVGAYRVNIGEIKPGVILAFLTYFNMITMGVMGLSRIFTTMSKASASANRIAEVLAMDTEELLAKAESIAADEEAPSSNAENLPADEPFIRFENVSFSYGKLEADGTPATADQKKKRPASQEEVAQTTADFGGEGREKALSEISFTMKKGETLGIIGPTGCGKSTIVNLLMRFYEADEGSIVIDGKPVSAYGKDDLRRKFGTVFQNDMIFQNTLYENIDFERKLDPAAIRSAVEDACAAEYVDGLAQGLQYEATIKGANLSGGQKQRMFVARALAGNPEILILDDSSSALDYKTDAAMRKAILAHHPDCTLILIAQRVSSVMNMDKILVLDNGKCIGYGTHEELLLTCKDYRETYEVQMGAMA